MSKAITSEGTFSNYDYTIRHRLSRMFDDCILATASAGSTTTLTLATANPGVFYNKPDDYFNNLHYEVYTYAGTNIGTSAVASDWVNDTHVLTVTPTAASAYGSTSKVELHRIFYTVELRDAMNQAINFYANKGYIKLQDETTISLTRTARNDNSSSYIYTYEYTMPTTFHYLGRVTTEDSEGGWKLTGTISDTFTLGETVTGGTSEATGLVSYSGSTYILVREVDGTFVVGETATGGTSEETCSAITAVDSITVGDGTFPEENIIDPRDWRIINQSSAPKLKLDENQYNVVADLRLRLEGEGIQDEVDADTDTIFLPPHEFVEVAATYLPFSKIESNNLTAKFNQCLETRARVEARPYRHPAANAKRVIV